MSFVYTLHGMSKSSTSENMAYYMVQFKRCCLRHTCVVAVTDVLSSGPVLSVLSLLSNDTQYFFFSCTLFLLNRTASYHNNLPQTISNCDCVKAFFFLIIFLSRRPHTASLVSTGYSLNPADKLPIVHSFNQMFLIYMCTTM